MNLKEIAILLGEARAQIKHSEYVIIGSLSVLGLANSTDIPARMTMSNDVDCYPSGDPGRVFELPPTLGQESDFAREHGYYLDPVSPRLPTLPDGWESRLIEVKLDNGILLKCLEPNDAAISKYARGEVRDQEWIRAGLEASILSMATIKHRLQFTLFLDDGEERASKERVTSDEAWLTTRRAPAKPKR